MRLVPLPRDRPRDNVQVKREKKRTEAEGRRVIKRNRSVFSFGRGGGTGKETASHKSARQIRRRMSRV